MSSKRLTVYLVSVNQLEIIKSTVTKRSNPVNLYIFFDTITTHVKFSGGSRVMPTFTSSKTKTINLVLWILFVSSLFLSIGAHYKETA